MVRLLTSANIVLKLPSPSMKSRIILLEFNKFKIPNLSTFQRLLKNVLLIIFLLSIYKMRWFLNLRRIDSGQAGSFIGRIIVPNIYYVIAIQKVAGKI